MFVRLVARSLQRIGALALLGLLALGPFLHAHWGQANRGGFHMDGAVVHHHAASADAPVMGADDEHESPAVGVAGSLPRGAEKTPSLGDVQLWVCSVLLAVLVAPAPPRERAPIRQRQPVRRTRANWPPLALAPPSA
jgi:hypothetical protein